MNCSNEEEYFRNYIQNDLSRIEKFKVIEFKCSSDSQRQKCYVTLSNFYKNIICCECSLKEFDGEFDDFVSFYLLYSNKCKDLLPIADQLDMLSIDYLFGSKSEENLEKMEAMLFANRDYALYDEFCKILESRNKEARFIKFMNEKWYELSFEYPWYDSCKKDNGTYVGYFSFIGSAIAKKERIKTTNTKYVVLPPEGIL